MISWRVGRCRRTCRWTPRAWLSRRPRSCPIRRHAPRLRGAARAAELDGLSRAEVMRAEAGSDGMSFSVTLGRTAPVLLFRLLGSVGSLVTVHATARVHPYASPRP